MYSAISAGTEGLVYRGEVPQDQPLDATLPSLTGSFEYPFAYGYSLVGKIVQTGPGVPAEQVGKTVFVFHPHASHALVEADECIPVPEDITAKSAIFLPNVETALGVVMDASPLIGSNVMVLGCGVVGLLTTALLAMHPLGSLIAADPQELRRRRAAGLGATTTLDPTDAQSLKALRDCVFSNPLSQGLDLVVELSGRPEALGPAIMLAGPEARIIVGSWYGTRSTPLNLGREFHRHRLRIESSQVSHIGAELTGRWNKPRRFALAWEMIRRLQPENLISECYSEEHCHQAFESSSNKTSLQVIFKYNQETL